MYLFLTVGGSFSLQLGFVSEHPWATAILLVERCRPLIILETTPEASWFAASLAPLGYRVEGSVNANSVVRRR